MPRFPSIVKFPLFRRSRPRPPSQVTALDVDGQTLRLVQAAPRGAHPGVTRVLSTSLALGGDERSDPQALGRAIAIALSQHGLRPGAVVMGVPRAQVVLRTLTLPARDDLRELASMVHLQVGRDLPFRLEDAVIDFKVRGQIPAATPRSETNGGNGSPAITVPETSPLKIEVLVAAVQRDVVDFYQQTAEAAGLKLAALGLLSYANAHCLEACRVAEGDEAVALVSLRPDEVSIDVIARQTLLFSRGANVKVHHDVAPPPAETPKGEADATPPPSNSTGATTEAPTPVRPETFADLVTIEVVRSLHSYSGMEPQNPVAKVVVIGATGQELEVVEALSKRVNVPASALDLATALELPADSREHATGSLAPIGLALGVSDARGLPFDFLNPKRPAVQRDMRRLGILAGAAAVAAVMMFVVALRAHFIRQRERTLASVNEEFAAAKQKQPIYQQMIRQSATVEDWLKGSRNWLEHYAYLSAILPASDEVYLTSLSVSGNGAIRLSVQARSGEILAKLDKQLRAAGYEVKPLAITPGADRHGYEFRSSVELLAPDKMKIDLSKVKTPPRLADDGSLDPVLRKGGGG